MIDITVDSQVGDKIIAIYKPTLVVDQIQAFNDGTFVIPADQNQVEFLTCSGEAQFDDGGPEVPITCGMLIDSNDELFVRYDAA